MLRKSLLLPALLSLGTLGIAGPALAHSVETNYILSDQAEFEIQVMFSTGEPFEEAPVQIYSPDNPETPLLEGTTDEEGRFAFQPDESAELGEWKMKIGELGHADILFVPISENGIEIDQVSTGMPTNNGDNRYWAAGLAILSAGIIAKAMTSRKQIGA